MSMQSKTAVVTGGGTGIGWGIAKAFAEAGCRVIIAGRREEKLRQAAEAWAGTPPLLLHPVDVADRASVQRLFAFAREQLGQIDILVNSAGTNIKTRTMATMTPEQWDQVMAINVTGAYNCMLRGPARNARAGRRTGHEHLVDRRQTRVDPGGDRVLCVEVRHDGPRDRRGQRGGRGRRPGDEYLPG